MNTLTPEQLNMIKRLQPKIVKSMGDWQEGDMYIMHGSNVHFVCKKDILDLSLYKLPCIPKPIDWQNPERGLWGMIDWKAYTFDIKHDGTVFLNKRSLTLQIDCISIGDIFTALLKALCEQEKV